MGCLVHAGILKEDKTLTDDAKNKFIREVKELLVYGSENLPTPVPFPCGDPMPPPNPPLRMEDFPLEDEKIYESFHRDIIKNQYEKTVASMDVDPTFSLLPALADPIALAGAFGVELPPVPFPDGFVPYLTGLLVPKFFLDLLKAGVTDFLLPVQLIPELAKLISIPEVPTIPALPPIELPPIVTLPPVPPPPTPPGLPAAEIPALPIPEVPAPPAPPVIALADVYLKDLALLEGIPKMIAEIISEIPKLISKIFNLAELFAYICGKVRDSGMFGQSAPENDLEKAASIVLARKISECIFHVAIAKTLGSGYGSLNASIAKTNGYNPPKKKESTAAARRKPSDIISEFAEASNKSSYGGDASSYVDRLYYYEMILSKMPPNSINVYGEPVQGAPLDGQTWKTIANQPDKFALERPSGFATWTDYAASAASSCGLFARACLFNAGANNQFFLSQYTDQTAISGIEFLGHVKNFKWVTLDSATGKLTLNQELVDLSTKYTEPRHWGINGVQHIPDELRNPKHFRENLSERAFIGFYELQDLARKGQPLPELNRGDIFVVAKYSKKKSQPKKGVPNTPATPSKDSYSRTNDHVSVVVNPVKSFQLPLSSNNSDFEDTLAQSIVTIDGGQTDDKNLSGAAAIGSAPLISKSDFYNGITQKNAQDGRVVNVANYSNTYFFAGSGPDRKFYKMNTYNWKTAPQYQDNLKANPNFTPPKGDAWDNFIFDDVTKLVQSGGPTAIIAGEYDVGVCVTQQLNRHPGYWLGKTRLETVGGTAFESKPANDGRKLAFNNNIRMIMFILRPDIFVDQYDASILDDEENAKVLFTAIRAQDNLPFIKKLTEMDSGKVKSLISVCFPSVPSGEEKKD